MPSRTVPARLVRASVPRKKGQHCPYLVASTKMPLCGLGIPKPELLDCELLQGWSKEKCLAQAYIPDTGYGSL